MPGNILNTDLPFPDREAGWEGIYDYVYQLQEMLRYSMRNLSEKNFNSVSLPELFQGINQGAFRVGEDGQAVLRGVEIQNADGVPGVRIKENGIEVLGSGVVKAELGYRTIEAGGTRYDYPFLQLGDSLIKKFTDGVWIGNRACAERGGKFAAQKGDTGLFVAADGTVRKVRDGAVTAI